MLVEEIMTTEIVTCDLDASLRIAAERMVARGIGSVIVVRDGDPFGIVTETDALRAGAATDRPFGEIDVREVVSHPLVTATGDTTVRRAVDRLHENGIKKLPVVDGTDLGGIVTLHDVTAHYGEFVAEAHELDRQRERWESDRGTLDEF